MISTILLEDGPPYTIVLLAQPVHKLNFLLKLYICCCQFLEVEYGRCLAFPSVGEYLEHSLVRQTSKAGYKSLRYKGAEGRRTANFSRLDFDASGYMQLQGTG